MIKFIKKYWWTIALGIVAVFGIASTAHGQVSNQYWKVLSNILQPVLNAYSLKVPSLANISCIGTDSTGLFGAGTCSGGGGGSGFTFTNNYGVLNAATSSVIWAQSGLNASSTSHFVNASTTIVSAETAYMMLNPTGNKLFSITNNSGNGGQIVMTDGANTDIWYTALGARNICGLSGGCFYMFSDGSSAVYASGTGANCFASGSTGEAKCVSSDGTTMAVSNSQIDIFTPTGAGLTVHDGDGNAILSNYQGTKMTISLNGFDFNTGDVGAQSFTIHDMPLILPSILSQCLQTNGSGSVGGSGSTCGLGTVTSVATNNGLTGGTITTTGTIGLNTAGFSTNALVSWNGSNLVATGTAQLTVGNLLATSTTLNSLFSAKVGISTTTPFSTLSVSTVAGVSPFSVGSSTGSYLMIDKSGNVGIKTANPAYALDVTGGIRGSGGLAADSGGLTFIDANRFACQNSGGTCTFTNLTTGSNSTVSIIGSNADNGKLILQATNSNSATTDNITLKVGSAGATTAMTIIDSGKIGIGTTSPYANLSIQSGASTGDAFVIATSTKAMIGGYDNDGHQFTGGPAPVISTCGTGTGTVVGDDQTGVITTATAATACTATFAKAYQAAPICIVTDDSLVGFASVSSVSTSAVTFGISSALTGGKLYYQCIYHK